ncbi:MAG: hypothetical protein E6J34_14925 [Chloroflexi bacterium]|nr:MAG: hypothetical protein E6J34_14925 [Chloroflexota bacterium]
MNEEVQAVEALATVNNETMYTSEGTYRSVTPVSFEHMTRERAFTALVYGLNTGDPRINPSRLRYGDVHTRGIG